MNPLVIGGVAAAALLAFSMGGKKSGITAKPGDTFSIEFTATNITADQLEKDLAASMIAKGNELVSFESLGGNEYRITVEYGMRTPIPIGKPVGSQGGVVMTTLSAEKV
jgi:hypothetical protein